jgi:hypothetical protein
VGLPESIRNLPAWLAGNWQWFDPSHACRLFWPDCYGRIGVEMMQGVFRDLGLLQDEPSLAVVKARIAALPQDHPLRSSMTVAPDLKFDAGLVDTFLHGRDRSYTVADCLDLVAAGGLVFQDWFLKSSCEPAAAPGNPFFSAVAAMPKEQRWGVMERVNHRNACHVFAAGRSTIEGSDSRETCLIRS